MNTIRLATATLLIAGMMSAAIADDTKKPTPAKGEKPKPSPGWVIVEEDWSVPLLGDFPSALHKAREHYRAKEDKSASVDIDKAITWLHYAQANANLKTAEELSTAEYDLMDVSRSLKSGKPVMAKTLDAAFAHASLALAKHHAFESGKAISRSDLKMAGRYLLSASDLMRNSAQSANLEYGRQVYDIYDGYAPYGYWDDSIVFEKGKLESNLSTIESELEKLGERLKTGK